MTHQTPEQAHQRAIADMQAEIHGLQVRLRSAVAERDELAAWKKAAMDQEPVLYVAYSDCGQFIRYWVRDKNRLAEKMAVNDFPVVSYYTIPKPTVSYLCNGARFKVSINCEGGTYCFDGYPELDGKWVALVDATDNKHMGASHD